MMRNVYLQGELGERFGPSFRMEVDNCQDILRCIHANRPEFRLYSIGLAEKNIDFAFDTHNSNEDLENKTEKELSLVSLKDGDITLSLIPQGSRKSAIGRIVIGAILIYIGGAMAEGIFASMVYGAGVAVVGSGVSMLLASDPDTDVPTLETSDYLYSGTTSRSTEGDPVPLLYGELRVPGRPISVSVRR